MEVLLTFNNISVKNISYSEGEGESNNVKCACRASRNLRNNGAVCML